MRDRWKEYSKLGLEQFISTAVSEDTRYCHFCKQIPQLRQQQNQKHYNLAQERIFQAAEVPVDSLRYKGGKSDLYVQKLHKEELRKIEDRDKWQSLLLTRMDKIRPSNKVSGHQDWILIFGIATQKIHFRATSTFLANNIVSILPNQVPSAKKLSGSIIEGKEDSVMVDNNADEELATLMQDGAASESKANLTTGDVEMLTDAEANKQNIINSVNIEIAEDCFEQLERK